MRRLLIRPLRLGRIGRLVWFGLKYVVIMLLTFCWIRLEELVWNALSLGSDGSEIRFVEGLAAAVA